MLSKPRVNLVGRRFGRLVVLSYAGHTTKASGDNQSTWNVRCDCGVTKTVVHGNLGTSTHSCGCLLGVKQRGLRRTDTPTYSGAHRRVRTLRGSARLQACTDCEGPATEWSYDHSDPNELHQIISGYDVPYSADPERYQPRCRSCHMRKDRNRWKEPDATPGGAK